MSTFLAITDAVRDALLADPALAGGRVRRGRALQVSAEEASGIAVNVIRSRADPLDLRGQSLQWETQVAVTVYARAPAGSDGESAVDPLLVSAWARLLDMTPPAGALAVTLDPAVQWDVDEADATIASAQLSLRVVHITTGAALAAT